MYNLNTFLYVNIFFINHKFGIIYDGHRETLCFFYASSNLYVNLIIMIIKLIIIERD